MSGINAAINRIKVLECPTGELEARVLEILQQYQVAENAAISVERDKNYDENGSRAYKATIKGEEEIIILAEAGLDDYVVKVVGAYQQ